MNQASQSSSKSINSPEYFPIRLRNLLLGHGILWIVIGIIILIVGDNALVLEINPGFVMSDTDWKYRIVKLYSDSFILVNFGTILVVLVFMVIPKLYKYRRVMLEAFYSLLIAGFFIEPLKVIVRRIRPFQEGSNIASQVNTFGELTDTGSMPSGHVGYTGAAVLPHAIHTKSKILPIVLSIYSAGMMFMRVFLGVHYPSDVLVGNIIALVSVTLAYLLFEMLYYKVSMTYKKEWIVFGIGLVIFIIQLIFRQ